MQSNKGFKVIIRSSKFEPTTHFTNDISSLEALNNISLENVTVISTHNNLKRLKKKIQNDTVNSMKKFSQLTE